ncbi:nucleotide-diphospho-sugar transferase [Xylogone sp. PMI_703]|nr:nucleotide-diphospho-sugar transferase [Xylogone sp. PMI_703]
MQPFIRLYKYYCKHPTVRPARDRNHTVRTHYINQYDHPSQRGHGELLQNHHKIATMTVSPLPETKNRRQTAPKFSNETCDRSLMSIEKCDNEDESDVMSMEPWRKLMFRFLPLTVILPYLLRSWAMCLQVQMLNGFQKEAASPRGLYLPRIMLLVQVALFSTEFLHALGKFSTLFGKWRPRLRLVGPIVPSIDVIVPCCNESIDVILDTVKGALAVDYPPHRRRVVVTDDGGSLELANAIAKLAIDQPNLYYTAREKTNRSGYKAGNLNHALKFLESLPSGPAGFVASLDADMIAERRWLRTVIAHLVQDPSLGLVCPPQHFYNFPRNDPLYQSQRHFWRCQEIVKDMADTAWNTGSGWIMRRQAVDDIGGFPTSCLVEDVASSMRLLAAGWKSAYVPEALQYGLLPETFQGHIKQWTRWIIGGCQLALQMRFYVSKSRTRALTLSQRLQGMANGISVLLGPVITVINMIITPIFLFSGSHLVYYHDLSQLQMLLRLNCLIILSEWVHDLHMSITSGYQLCIREGSNKYWMAPYYSFAIIQSFILPSWLGGKVTGFTPSGSIRDPLNERRPRLRSPLRRRLQSVLFDCGAIFHVVLVFLCIAGVVSRVHQAFVNSGGDMDQLRLELLVTVAWPPPTWFQIVIACLTPLQYAIFPPDVPERQDLLRRELATGVMYPTERSKRATWTIKEARYSQLHFLIILYTIYVFKCTWWIF